jgi:hypothetical protein
MRLTAYSPLIMESILSWIEQALSRSLRALSRTIQALSRTIQALSRIFKHFHELYTNTITNYSSTFTALHTSQGLSTISYTVAGDGKVDNLFYSVFYSIKALCEHSGTILGTLSLFSPGALFETLQALSRHLQALSWPVEAHFWL